MGTPIGDRDEHTNNKQDQNMENGNLKTNQQELDFDEINIELEQAKDEWDCVEDVTFAYGERNQIKKSLHVDSSHSLITFDQAMDHFRSRDMSEYKVHIVPVITYSGIASFVRKLWGPPRLDSVLEDSRDLLFAIASCPLQNNETVHIRVLQTIYKQLTNSTRDASRCGPHWDFIGFQGNDPATDLRGVGFLGLMHLLYFVMEPSMLPLAKAILKLSHHPTQNFPFAVMGINITRIVLQTLREERLNKECNKARNVVSVTNVFYVGLFLHLYETWQKQRLTIKDSGWVLKGIENTAKRKPKLVFQRLNNYFAAEEKLAPSVPAAADGSPQLTLLTAPLLTAPLPNGETDTTPRICHMEPYPMADDDAISENSETSEAELQLQVPSLPSTPSVQELKAASTITSEEPANMVVEDNGSYSGDEIFI